MEQTVRHSRGIPAPESVWARQNPSKMTLLVNAYIRRLRQMRASDGTDLLVTDALIRDLGYRTWASDTNGQDKSSLGLCCERVVLPIKYVG